MGIAAAVDPSRGKLSILAVMLLLAARKDVADSKGASHDFDSFLEVVLRRFFLFFFPPFGLDELVGWTSVLVQLCCLLERSMAALASAVDCAAGPSSFLLHNAKCI